MNNVPGWLWCLIALLVALGILALVGVRFHIST